jgi:hypothetical protein
VASEEGRASIDASRAALVRHGRLDAAITVKVNDPSMFEAHVVSVSRSPAAIKLNADVRKANVSQALSAAVIGGEVTATGILIARGLSAAVHGVSASAPWREVMLVILPRAGAVSAFSVTGADGAVAQSSELDAAGAALVQHQGKLAGRNVASPPLGDFGLVLVNGKSVTERCRSDAALARVPAFAAPPYPMEATMGSDGGAGDDEQAQASVADVPSTRGGTYHPRGAGRGRGRGGRGGAQARPSFKAAGVDGSMVTAIARLVDAVGCAEVVRQYQAAERAAASVFCELFCDSLSSSNMMYWLGSRKDSDPAKVVAAAFVAALLSPLQACCSPPASTAVATRLLIASRVVGCPPEVTTFARTVTQVCSSSLGTTYYDNLPPLATTVAAIRARKGMSAETSYPANALGASPIARHGSLMEDAFGSDLAIYAPSASGGYPPLGGVGGGGAYQGGGGYPPQGGVGGGGAYHGGGGYPPLGGVGGHMGWGGVPHSVMGGYASGAGSAGTSSRVHPAVHDDAHPSSLSFLAAGVNVATLLHQQAQLQLQLQAYINMQAQAISPPLPGVAPAAAAEMEAAAGAGGAAAAAAAAAATAAPSHATAASYAAAAARSLAAAKAAAQVAAGAVWDARQAATAAGDAASSPAASRAAQALAAASTASATATDAATTADGAARNAAQHAQQEGLTASGEVAAAHCASAAISAGFAATAARAAEAAAAEAKAAAADAAAAAVECAAAANSAAAAAVPKTAAESATAAAASLRPAPLDRYNAGTRATLALKAAAGAKYTAGQPDAPPAAKAAAAEAARAATAAEAARDEAKAHEKDVIAAERVAAGAAAKGDPDAALVAAQAAAATSTAAANVAKAFRDATAHAGHASECAWQALQAAPSTQGDYSNVMLGTWLADVQRLSGVSRKGDDLNLTPQLWKVWEAVLARLKLAGALVRADEEVQGTGAWRGQGQVLTSKEQANYPSVNTFDGVMANLTQWLEALQELPEGKGAGAGQKGAGVEHEGAGAEEGTRRSLNQGRRSVPAGSASAARSRGPSRAEGSGAGANNQSVRGTTASNGSVATNVLTAASVGATAYVSFRPTHDIGPARRVGLDGNGAEAGGAAAAGGRGGRGCGRGGRGGMPMQSKRPPTPADSENEHPAKRGRY